MPRQNIVQNFPVLIFIVFWHPELLRNSYVIHHKNFRRGGWYILIGIGMFENFLELISSIHLLFLHHWDVKTGQSYSWHPNWPGKGSWGRSLQVRQPFAWAHHFHVVLLLLL